MTDTVESDPTPAPPASLASASVQAAGRTNVLAFVALVLGIFVPVGGVICGAIALGQVKRTGESGRGLAMAGLIIGVVFTVVGVIGIIAFGGLAAGASSQLSNFGN